MPSLNPAFLLRTPRLRTMIKSTVSELNTPMAKARTRRVLAATARPMKLEIGGLLQRDGWVVTNVNAVTRNYLDCTTRWPIEDAAASYIYSDNVIEHLPLAAGRAMMAEAYRVLQPGGVIRLVTPDIRKHVELYLAGVSSIHSDVAKDYRDMGLVVEHPIDLVRIPIGSFGHHEGYVYDFDVLEQELKRAGFNSIVECGLGESEHDALRGLDFRVAEGGAQIVVEATR
ncbi:MAG: hypothetical protein JWR52_2857 [Marmoricola sp.]|nr:hypothetical protein [Marmoricola sp.]